jgi:alpha-L-rhamnosidase
MLPDGSINPGEMTSFNHYAYGAVAKFMVERVAGLQQVEAGWKKSRVQPEVVGDFRWATASHLTPYGKLSSSWKIENTEGKDVLYVDVEVPTGTTMEVVLPDGEQVVGSGKWSFKGGYEKRAEWPVKEIKFILQEIVEGAERGDI